MSVTRVLLEQLADGSEITFRWASQLETLLIERKRPGTSRVGVAISRRELEMFNGDVDMLTAAYMEKHLRMPGDP